MVTTCIWSAPLLVWTVVPPGDQIPPLVIPVGAPVNLVVSTGDQTTTRCQLSMQVLVPFE